MTTTVPSKTVSDTVLPQQATSARSGMLQSLRQAMRFSDPGPSRSQDAYGDQWTPALRGRRLTCLCGDCRGV